MTITGRRRSRAARLAQTFLMFLQPTSATIRSRRRLAAVLHATHACADAAGFSRSIVQLNVPNPVETVIFALFVPSKVMVVVIWLVTLSSPFAVTSDVDSTVTDPMGQRLPVRGFGRTRLVVVSVCVVFM